ncbi:homeobox protein ceh-63 [Bombyx mori]|uniref:Hox cluster protein Shx11 n=1 Tax=Bombyx mori TaxID=7091 RepID=A0A0I9QQQ1_BOMMO|nr:homeobox protein ceh-30 [Bombyx mori]XP_037867738.1 homeobox protein ceh-30-like [Bombyx mori]DAA64849.1 TPA_inf: Hox cluster protein Shx11 [Bombyx mori]
MFQSILLSDLTPHSNTYEQTQWENGMPFTESSTVPECDTKKESIKTARKKCKRLRTNFTWEQLRMLESTFEKTNYIHVSHRRELAQKLGIEEKCIRNWFQNRRMKKKRQSSESSDSLAEPETMNPQPSSNSPVINPDYNFVLPSNHGENLYATSDAAQTSTNSLDAELCYGTNIDYTYTQYYPINTLTYNSPVQDTSCQYYEKNNYWCPKNFNNFNNLKETN